MVEFEHDILSERTTAGLEVARACRKKAQCYVGCD